MRIKALLTKDTYIKESKIIIETRFIGILLIRKTISADCVTKIG